MVWSQRVKDRSEASKLERKTKHMTKAQKEELITKK
jgi:predicted GIY-YIG superfamily endonuclease